MRHGQQRADAPAAAANRCDVPSLPAAPPSPPRQPCCRSAPVRPADRPGRHGSSASRRSPTTWRAPRGRGGGRRRRLRLGACCRCGVSGGLSCRAASAHRGAQRWRAVWAERRPTQRGGGAASFHTVKISCMHLSGCHGTKLARQEARAGQQGGAKLEASSAVSWSQPCPVRRACPSAISFRLSQLSDQLASPWRSLPSSSSSWSACRPLGLPCGPTPRQVGVPMRSHSEPSSLGRATAGAALPRAPRRPKLCLLLGINITGRPCLPASPDAALAAPPRACRRRCRLPQPHAAHQRAPVCSLSDRAALGLHPCHHRGRHADHGATTQPGAAAGPYVNACTPACLVFFPSCSFPARSPAPLLLLPPPDHTSE